MRLLIIVLSISGCVSTQQQWSPSTVAMTFASVPAHVCIAVNSQRNNILVDAGNEVQESLASGDITIDEARSRIRALHRYDDELEILVSPSYVDSSRVRRFGVCRVVTERLEALSSRVVMWGEMDNDSFIEAVTIALATVRFISK